MASFNWIKESKCEARFKFGRPDDGRAPRASINWRLSSRWPTVARPSIRRLIIDPVARPGDRLLNRPAGAPERLVELLYDLSLARMMGDNNGAEIWTGAGATLDTPVTPLARPLAQPPPAN